MITYKVFFIIIIDNLRQFDLKSPKDKNDIHIMSVSNNIKEKQEDLNENIGKKGKYQQR